MGTKKIRAQRIHSFLLFYFLCSTQQLFSIPTGIISVVYNLRISETTQLITQEFKDPFGIDFTFFEEARWQNKARRQRRADTSNALGALVSFLYVVEPCAGKSWYLSSDFAFARVSEKSGNLKLARVQTDDLFLAGGYSWLLYSNVRFTASGIGVIPTHKDTSLEQIQFGTGHAGLGIQFDTAINYYPKNKCSLRMAARLIGTLPRTARFRGYDYNYNLGEIVDLYIAHHASLKSHCFELGYNPTFVVASNVSPSISSFKGQLDLIRNSYYAAYEYSFDVRKINNAIEVGLSFSSDVYPKRTGQQLIIFAWGTWDISF